MLLKIKTLAKNTSNWKYDVIGVGLYINTKMIKTIGEVDGIYFIRFIRDTHQDEIAIDKNTLDQVLVASNEH